MINANRYLKRRRGRDRSGERWYLQVPAPTDLRPRFGHAVVRALNTSDPRVARIRRDALLPEIRTMFDCARAEPKLEVVLGAVRREEMARAHATWSELVADRGIAASCQALAVLLDEEFLPCEHEHIAAPSDAWQRQARRVLLRHGLAPTDEATERIAGTLLEAHVEGAELAIDGRAAPVPVNGSTPAPVPEPPSSVSLDTLAADWERERRPIGRTKMDFRRALRRLREHVGHDDAARLSREDITSFRDAMLDRGSWKTAFNAIGAVRAVLGVAVRTGKLAHNPAAGVTVRKVHGPRARLPFDDAEAALILENARRQRGARRWLPWLLACTGARLEEACQARVQDVRQERSIWYLDITSEAGSLKNAGSARKVPLHPALIAEGFLEYVKSLPPSGPLFPDLKPDMFGRRGGTATKVLGRALRKLGITDRRKVAGHSWRHRFKDQCRAAGIEKALHDALTGHASGDVGDGYGLGYPLPVLKAAVEKLPFPK